MNNIGILYEIEKEPILFELDRYDGMSTLYIRKYNENKFFLYFWYDQDYNKKTEKSINKYMVVELNYKDLEDISLKKYPLVHFFKTRDIYMEIDICYFSIENRDLTYEKYNLDDNYIMPNDYVLEEIEELKLYLIKNKVNKF